MRRRAIVLGLLTVFGAVAPAVASDTRRSLVAIEPRSPWTLQELEQAGADLVSYDPDTGVAYVTVDPRQERLLWERGFAVSTVDLDVQAGFERLSQEDPGLGLYTTWDELLLELANLQRVFPDLTHVETLGTSIEGRSIPVLKISDHAAEDDPSEPDVLIVGNHHARELMSVEVPLHLARTLLSSYATDPDIRRLVDEREVWIVPMLNPDGHVYQQETQERPGWRKNRRLLDDGVFGVDLNRNYPFRWGLDDEGSSGNFFNETYRGATPLSEPESQALMRLVQRQEFEIALSYHSFGELLLYPWGYTRMQRTPDHAVYVALAAEMVRDNGYRPGNAYSGVIYVTNGGWGDTMYGDTSTKSKQTFAFTVELNSLAQGGFWPPESLIQPTCDRLLSLNLYALEVAADVRAATPPAAPLLSGVQDVDDPRIVHLTWEQPGDPEQIAHYEVFEIDPLGSADAWQRSRTVTMSGDARAILATGVRLGPGGQLGLRLEAELAPLWDYAYVEVRPRGARTWSVLPGAVTRDANPTQRNAGHGITGALAAASYLFDAQPFAGRELDVAVRLDAHDDTPRAPYLQAELDVPATLTEERRVIAPEVHETRYDVHAERAGIFAYGVTAVDLQGQRTDSELRWFAIPEVTAVEIEDARLIQAGDRTQLSWETRSHTPARYEAWTRPLSVGEAPGSAHDEWRRGDFEKVAQSTRAEPGALRLEWPSQPGRRAVLLVATDHDGVRVWGPWVASRAPTTRLEPAAPNPFNPSTRLRYEVAAESRVTLDIVDVSGRRVRRLVSTVAAPGAYVATWDGRDDHGRELASGVYVAQLQTAHLTQTRRLVLLR